MAFGAHIARAAEDEQAARALSQPIDESDEDTPAVSRPAAPSAAPAAPIAAAQPTATTPSRFSRPAFNAARAETPPAPVAAASERPPVAPAAAAPVEAQPPVSRRFVRPSLAAAQASTPLPPSVSPSPVQRPAASSAPVASPTASVPSSASASEQRPRFAFGRSSTGSAVATPSAQPATSAATPVSPAPAPVSASAPVTSSPARSRFSFKRSDTAPEASGGAPAASAAPARSGGFRPGGFRANGVGDAPVRPTGEEDDEPSATSVSQAFRPSVRPSLPTSTPVTTTPVARSGGFRGNGVSAAPVRPTGEEDEMPARGRGTSRDNASSVKKSASGLDVRLDRLIDVVCEHQNVAPDDIVAIKKRALQNPDAVSQEYDRIFKEEVEPIRHQNAQRFETLQEAMATHPGKVVFMHIKDGKQHLVGLDRAKAGAAVMYEGQMIETVDASRTMFAPPSVLFAAAAAPEVVTTDDNAFDDGSEPSPAAVSRAPRP